MKKLIIPFLLGMALVLYCFNASAATYCWTDGFSHFVLTGGKINLKPFSGKFVSNAFGCHGTLWGSIFATGPGIYTVTIIGNIPPPCVNFTITLTTDSTLNGTATYDNFEDAIMDGTSLLTKVSCDQVPKLQPVGKDAGWALPTIPVAGYQPE